MKEDKQNTPKQTTNKRQIYHREDFEIRKERHLERRIGGWQYIGEGSYQKKIPSAEMS